MTDVEVKGATREFTAGRPDLPWVGERVEIPSGLKVVGVEVVSIESAPLAERAMMPSAILPRPGLGPIERTAPDPEYFARVRVNPDLGTICWPNDADWDPLVLYSLLTRRPIESLLQRFQSRTA